ncbi:hypothetical protein INS49_000180 [Diaporthe citri]|uniref:uncharacterized protein n=1 Tax=Diaporthe citri TaxID=83186 RepID=UPI001C8078CF|nr:uncharacterized protein INS49_000180 [Diaporthe citri]KAG6366004.1 hypothetical protein INS49_000180 [Diaporthe citri]
MKLADMRHGLQAVFLAASLASTTVAEPFEECSLAYRHNIAADVACGAQDAVTRCLSDLAGDQGLLQNCLVSAGCPLQDAKVEAARAAKRCKSNSESDGSNMELRQLRGRHGLRTIREVVEVRAAQDKDDSDSEKTTLATLAIRETTTAAPTSTNTWVMVQHLKGTTYTTVTCMTPATVATSACSFINDADETACVATTAVIPSCVPGMKCGYSQTSGAVRCATTGGMGIGGIIVGSVLGVGAAVSIITICSMCIRERSRNKRDRRAAEAQAALAKAAEAKRAPRAATGMAGGGDYVPLMGAGDAAGGREGPEISGPADPFRGVQQQYFDSR